MAEFNIAFQKMLVHEGDYINDPDDSGGETYKGVSRNSHKLWSGWTLIDKNKYKSGFPFNLDKDVDLQKAIELFYRTNFWLPLNADQISNQTIANSLFDFSVNAGITTSVRLIQSIIGTKADAIIGEQTVKRLNSIDFSYVQTAFTVAKMEYYIHIIKQRLTNKKYLYGWIVRALEYNE